MHQLKQKVQLLQMAPFSLQTPLQNLQTRISHLQGLLSRGMAAADVQQGWDLAVSPTHLAVTLPSCVIAVYAFQVSLVQLHHAHLQLSLIHI